MKHKEIIRVVEENFETLNKLHPEILKHFNSDNIHDFRVEVKKLRAFLRLLDIKKDEPLIPKLLKTFYGYIGIIRNIQLQEHALFKFTADHKAKEPKEYVQLLKKEKAHWKKEAQELMNDNNFNKVKEKIIQILPGKLEKSTIKKFVENKLAELKKHIKKTEDEIALHEVRKILKDIYYNLGYIKDNADLPKAIAKKQALKSLNHQLGSFMDKYFQLEFLHHDYLSKLHDETEKAVLLTMKSNWVDEKILIKQELRKKLNELHQQL